jgi:hypothetical protein
MIDGHGNGRSKRSGTVRNDLERFGTIWNEVKNLVTGRSRHGHGHVTFSAINERFTVTIIGSEKNDPNLRNGILGKCVTPFIL